MPENTFDDKSKLVMVMDWRHHERSHHLSQRWPRSMWPNDITKPCGVNFMTISLAWEQSYNWHGWGSLSQLPPFRYFPYFSNTLKLLNSMFIVNRCRRSSDAATPVKYECDSKNMIGTFARSKILFTEKFTNGSLVPPIPAAGDVAVVYGRLNDMDPQDE